MTPKPEDEQNQPQEGDAEQGEAIAAPEAAADAVSPEPLAPSEAHLSEQDWLEIAQFSHSWPHQPTRRYSAFSYIGLAVSLGLAIVLLAVCALISPFTSSATSHVPPRPAQGVPTLVVTPGATGTSQSILDFATQAPDPTPLPYNYPTPTFEVTATPTINVPTPPPVVPPGDGSQAVLSVAPLFFPLHCQNRGSKVIFFISNLGATTMAWQASVSGQEGAYHLAPQNGTLDPGERQSVTVSRVNQSGGIFIQAGNAANSPQTVTIACY